MPGLRLLLVEDHALFRHSLRRVLETLPDVAGVAEAGDGPGALQQIGRLQPDIILCDLHLPGMPGLEVIRLVRQRYPACVIIVLSVADAAEVCREALQAGASAYITKDTSLVRLLALIRQIGASRTASTVPAPDRRPGECLAGGPEPGRPGPAQGDMLCK